MYRLNLSVLFKGAGKSSALFARYFSQPTTTHTFPPAAKKMRPCITSVPPSFLAFYWFLSALTILLCACLVEIKSWGISLAEGIQISNLLDAKAC